MPLYSFPPVSGIHPFDCYAHLRLHRSITVQGTGTGHLPLECQHFINEAEDGTPETVDFCSNAADDVRIPGRVVARTPLAPYALTDPLALPDSCTAASVAAPAWRFGDFQTSTAGNGSLRFNVELQTTNAPSGYPLVIAVDRWAAAETGWRPCEFGPSDGWLGPSNCTFAFDAATRVLALDAEWKCSDLDTAHPYVFTPASSGNGSRNGLLTVDRITFTGSMKTTVPGLTCRAEEEAATCASTAGMSWTEKIGGVKWTSSGWS